MYNTKSSRDIGTLFFFRQKFGRTNVPAKVKKNYSAAEALMLQVTRAHLCEAFVTWASMENLESQPLTLDIPSTSATKEEKLTFIEEKIGGFVDKFVLMDPDVKGMWELEEVQLRKSKEVVNNTVSSNKQDLYIPGRLS